MPPPEYNIQMRQLPAEMRPRERLAANGPQALSTGELLAILLRSGSRGESVLRLAERIITQFGSVKGVASATLLELSQVKGVGMAKAAQLMAAVEIGKRLSTYVDAPRAVIRSPEDLANLVSYDMRFLPQEQFKVFLLDARHQVLRERVATSGGLMSSLVDCREVFREAIGANCAAVAVCHNHPSGDPTPSAEDISITRRLNEAGKLLGVDLLDHVIIGDGRWVSMKQRGLF